MGCTAGAQYGNEHPVETSMTPHGDDLEKVIPPYQTLWGFSKPLGWNSLHLRIKKIWKSFVSTSSGLLFKPVHGDTVPLGKRRKYEYSPSNLPTSSCNLD